MIIWEVSDELGVRTAALLGRFGGGIVEGASEDAGADEREGDAVQAVVLENAQGVVVGIEQLLEGRGGSAEVRADCVDDVFGVSHVEGGGDDCGAVLKWGLILGTCGGQSGHAGLFEDHTTDTATGQKTAVCGVDDCIDGLIGAGGVDQYDFAHGDSSPSNVGF